MAQAISLLQLPLEIRTLIYGYVFAGHCEPIDRRRSGLRFWTSGFQQAPLAIALTSRQLYYEVEKQWFQQVTFHIYSPQSLLFFLNSITSSNQRAIQYISCEARLGVSRHNTYHILHHACMWLPNLREVNMDYYRSLPTITTEHFLEQIWQTWLREAGVWVNVEDDLQNLVSMDKPHGVAMKRTALVRRQNLRPVRVWVFLRVTEARRETF